MKRSHYLLLREAIDMAAAWKGGKMPEDWPEFDAQIERMRYALEQAKKNIEPAPTRRLVLNATKEVAREYATAQLRKAGHPWTANYTAFLEGYRLAVREQRARFK